MLSKIKKYRHGFIIAIYFVAYLILFGYLEQRPVRAYHVVHTVFDDMIPFCEIFIIPYLLWFPYVVITVVYFLFRNKNKKGIFPADLQPDDGNDGFPCCFLHLSERSVSPPCGIPQKQHLYTTGGRALSDRYSHQHPAKYPCI